MGDMSAYRKLSRNDPLDKHHCVDMLKQKNTACGLMFYGINVRDKRLTLDMHRDRIQYQNGCFLMVGALQFL
jgi:hypothetical protein